MTKKLSYVLLALLTMGLLTSCYTNEIGDVEESSSVSATDVVMLVDTANNTHYSCMLSIPGADGLVMAKVGNESDMLEYIDVATEENQFARVQFDDEGLVKSISAVGEDTVTICFGNYSGNKVDAVISYAGEVLMLKELECDYDWDEVAQSILANKRARSLQRTSALATRGVVDSFKETVESTLKVEWKYVKYLADQFIGVGSLVWSGVKEHPGIVLGLKGLSWFNKILEIGIPESVFKTVDTIASFGAALVLNNPVSWAVALVTHYDLVEDFFTAVWLKVFEFIDWAFVDEDPSWGILSSGFGALKATLTWNFYADVDLYAKEPSGIVIYYKNKYSYLSGGFLDVDNRNGGPGAVENIYWENPEEGVYEFELDYYGSSLANGREETGTCTVVILYNGIGKPYNIPLGVDETAYVCGISLPQGTFSGSRILHKQRFGIKIDKNGKTPELILR